MRQRAGVHEIERAGKHLLALGRKAGDHVGAERDVGPQGAQQRAEGNRLGVAVAALHALEDEIIAGLQ